jgi:TusA-related sulfurtransferase
VAWKIDSASGKENMSMISRVTNARHIEAWGTYCPGLLELMSELETAEAGVTIVVISSQPECRSDIPSWVQESGNELLAMDTVEGGAVRFIVRKHIRR